MLLIAKHGFPEPTMLMKTHELRGITRDVYEKKGVRCQLPVARFQVPGESGFRF